MACWTLSAAPRGAAVHHAPAGLPHGLPQELIRHANSKVTLDFYAQAMTPAKHEARAKS